MQAGDRRQTKEMDFTNRGRHKLWVDCSCMSWIIWKEEAQTYFQDPHLKAGCTRWGAGHLRPTTRDWKGGKVPPNTNAPIIKNINNKSNI